MTRLEIERNEGRDKSVRQSEQIVRLAADLAEARANADALARRLVLALRYGDGGTREDRDVLAAYDALVAKR